MLQPNEHERRRQSLQRATVIALVVWPTLALLDLAASYVEPGRLWFYLALRSAGVSILALAVMRLRSPRPPSAGELTAIDIALTTSLSALVALSCREFGGLESPLVFGVIVVVLGRATLLPDHARRSVWPLGGAALAYVFVPLFLAAFDSAIRAQWTDRHSLGTFAMHVGCVFSAAGVGIVGGHFVSRYRNALREARTLARYELVRRIGRGGMGEIWRARDRILGREVALKILRPDRSDPRTAARFHREILKTAALRHPNTIRVFDYGTSDDGRAYYSMELLDGCDLATLIAEQGPLEPARAVTIARQAADALAEAHARRIVHRDIKPENLFLVQSGEHDFVKVLDFGLAKLIDTDPALTSVGHVVGTPSWLAPESIRGAMPDERTDVYALGCVLYFLLTGTAPFSGTTQEVLAAHVREIPELPSVRLAKRGRHARLDPELERVVMRCLEKKPQARFATAAGLAQALETCETPDQRTIQDVRPTHAFESEDSDSLPATLPT